MFLVITIFSFATYWIRVASKSPAQDPAAAEAQVLFEEFFNWRLDRSPEFATLIGIEGHDDKLGQEITKIF